MSLNNVPKFMIINRLLMPVHNKSFSSRIRHKYMSVHNTSSVLNSKFLLLLSNTIMSLNTTTTSTPRISTQTADHSPKIAKIVQTDKREEQPHKVSRLGKAINQTKTKTTIYKTGSSKLRKRNKDKRKKKRGHVNKNALKCSSFKITIPMGNQEEAPQFERYI